MPIRIDGEFIAHIHHGSENIVKVYKGTELVWVPRPRIPRLFLRSGGAVQYWTIPAGIGRLRGIAIGAGGSRGLTGVRGSDTTRSRPYKCRCRDRTRRVCETVTRYRIIQDTYCAEYEEEEYCADERRVITGYTYSDCFTFIRHPAIRPTCSGYRRGNRCCYDRDPVYGKRCLRTATRRGDCIREATRPFRIPYEAEECERKVVGERCDTCYETVTDERGGSGGSGGYGGHGFHETFDETVNEGDEMRVTFRSNGNVEVANLTNWDVEANGGGQGGRGGRGGRGRSIGGRGATGSSVTTFEDRTLYNGQPGHAATSNRGGRGGDGASGIQLGSASGFQSPTGPLDNPFSFIVAGDGYTAPGLFRNAGRGQGLNAATPGVAYLIGTKE